MPSPKPIGPEQTAFNGKIIQVIQQDMQIGDKKVTFERARRAPGTRLIIIRDQKILLTKEYRNEIQDYDIRLPGGKVFDSLKEYSEFLNTKKTNILSVAQQAAKREALEEAGIIANQINHFTTSHSGATVEWDLFYFIVIDFTVSEQRLEHGENIETKWYTFEQAKSAALNGQMREDRSVAVLLKYLHTQNLL